MAKPSQDLHLDFETYCELDLKKVGVHRYAEHASFRVLCVAWKLEGQPASHTAMVTTATARLLLPPELVQALGSPDVQAHAHNAAFESAVLAQLKIPVANPISCTLQRALAYGLPGKLEHAAAALGLEQQKDMVGHRLMLRMSRPLPAGAAPWEAADYHALARYCLRDVETEAALSAAIPHLLPEEGELAQLDAAMNNRGELGVDIDRVPVLQAAAGSAEKTDAARCAVLTGGAVTSPGTQTARLLAWLKGKGLELPDVARATVEEALAEKEGENPEATEVLQIRLRMARASTRKLKRMLEMAEPETGALRGQFQFCGAGRTGRWSGRGVQVQNLPRVPKGFSPDLFARMALAAVTEGAGALDAVAGHPVLDCVSWSLRSCLKATDDSKVLWSFDFSQIEARVLAWLAGQRDILTVFASGEDVYVWAAAQFGSKDRQLGKVLVLALGFGMGAARLREQAWKGYGVRMTAEEAERFKTGWRATNYKIVHFWYEMEAAATAAILRRGSGHVAAVGGSGVAFTCTGKTLQLRLPSRRVLYYHGVRISREDGGIVYWGPEVGGRWVEQRTWGGKLAENATQACARDVMSEAMLRAWRRNSMVPCMSVHDELVYPLPLENPRSMLRITYTLADLMLEAPPWAGGLPLDGEHKVMRRYGVVDAIGSGIASTPRNDEYAA
jgi:DNA polymerase bacteriophage-type